MELAWEDSTRALAVWPFAPTPPRLPASQAALGVLGGGGVFRWDPFDLYAARWLTNPNLLVLGEVGRGKSALVKLLALRRATTEGSLLVLDPKGEYGPLARALGALLVVPSGDAAAIDPLAGAEGPTERSRALGALAEALLERGLDPLERAVIAGACRELVAGVRGAAARLEHPESAWFPMPVRSEGVRAAGRLAAVLARVVDGDLAGLWDVEGCGVELAPRVSWISRGSEAGRGAGSRSPRSCACAWLSSPAARCPGGCSSSTRRGRSCSTR
jgi:hypothetical protein